MRYKNTYKESKKKRYEMTTKLNLFVNGRDVTKAINESELETLVRAITTSNPDSIAWQNLTQAVDSPVVSLLKTLAVTTSMEVLVNDKPRTQGLTIGKFTAKFAVAAKVAEWDYAILTEKGVKVAKESTPTNLDALTELLTASDELTA
jgi:hypothetical protein